MGLKKTIALGVILASLFSSSSVAAPPKRHPLYPVGDPMITYRQQVPANREAVLGKCRGADQQEIQQSVYINVPGFYLRLENKIEDEVCSSFTFPVRVGRHWEKHFSKPSKVMETPIGEGAIVNKSWRGIFRYFDDVWKTKCVRYERNKRNKLVCAETKRFLIHRKGDIIKETSTYTDEGVPMTVPIEYDWMHALRMGIHVEETKGYTTRCVIHATTDSHTVGNATSHCCVGLRIPEMLKLYGLVVPQQERGEVKQSITLKLEYKLVERQGAALVLHTDIYDRKEDYAALIEAELHAVGYDNIDQERMNREIDQAKIQFDEAYKNLRRKLLQDRFITREEVGKLHYSVPIVDLVEKK